MKQHIACFTGLRLPMTATLLSAILLALLAINPAQAEPLRVAVSIAPQAWLVNQIGGELVQTSILIPPGSDPHTYEPKPSQVTEMSKAALYLTMGLGFEKAWLPRIQGTTSGMRTVSMGKGVEKIAMATHEHHDHGHEHGNTPAPGEHDHDHALDVKHHPATDGRSHGEYDDHEKLQAESRQWTDRQGPPDPHIWTDPANMLIMAKNTFEALQDADKAHAEAYVQNYFKVKKTIEGLERELMKIFAAHHGQGRSFMVFHPAWGYFAKAHALTQVPIEIEGHEPGPKELARLVDQGRDLGVKVIFVQPQRSSKAAQVVAGEIGATVIEADPLALDWANNLRTVAREFRDALR